MSSVAAVVAAVSAAVVLYVYVGYPLLLVIVARLWPRPVTPGTVTPPMTVIVPAHDEEETIAAKVANTLAVDYPHDALEVVVVDDGSSDRTVERVRPLLGERVRLLELPRGGKAAALNAGVRAASGELLLFTDANVELDAAAPRRLARWFADPGVGGVSGCKRALLGAGEDTTERGENLYWRWDQWQKRLESRIGSIFAADGTLYAIRRELYVPIADPAQADDIAISARVVMQGRRLLFDPDAIARERPAAEGSAELSRKIRVTNHSVRALLNLGPALWRHGFWSLELLSHKLLRHLVPFVLLTLLGATAALAPGRPLAALALAAQLGFYALGTLGAALRRRPIGAARPLAIPYYFCLVNTGAFLGVLSILRGRRVRSWAPRGT